VSEAVRETFARLPAVVLGIAEPEVMADLGHGVMDDAMVEAAAYCLRKQ
jgi:hypothetical protein